MRLRKNNPTNYRKATNVLLQDPNFPTPIPLPVEPKPRPNYQDPTVLAGLASLPRDGMTVIMPAVQPHWPAAALDDTQVLPVVSEPVPPSARHTDPARHYYEQTFVEDADLEPQSRGRHVLNELIAEDAGAVMPDLVSHDETTPAIQGAYGRIVAALAAPDSLAGAVRIARRAYKASKISRRWFVEEESKLDACRRRIAEFNADWDQSLRNAEIARHGHRAVVAAEELTAAYENNRLRIAEENARRAADGITPLDVTATTFTRGMQAKVKDMLVAEALSGSAVSR